MILRPVDDVDVIVHYPRVYCLPMNPNGGHMDVSGTIVGVQGKPTKKGGLIYEVTFDNGISLKTMDGGLATQAQTLLLKPASARYTTQEGGPNPRGGTYSATNWMEDIAAGGTLPASQDVSGIPIVGQGGNGATSAVPVPGIPIVGSGSGGGRTPEEESRIVKQAVIKAAAVVVGNLFQGAGPEAAEQAFELLDQKAGALYERVYGAQNVAAPAVTPAAVVAAVNTEIGSEAVALGATVPQW
jgi:hypothetical protein